LLAAKVAARMPRWVFTLGANFESDCLFEECDSLQTLNSGIAPKVQTKRISTVTPADDISLPTARV
jgi:hypothetical protein